jgi:hypothetical protein
MAPINASLHQHAACLRERKSAAVRNRDRKFKSLAPHHAIMAWRRFAIVV